MASFMDYLVDLVKNSDTATDSQVNALATATVAAKTGRHNVALKVDASYNSSATSGLLQVKFGATVKAEKYIHGAGAIDFGVYGLQNPVANQALTAELAAGGV